MTSSFAFKMFTLTFTWSDHQWWRQSTGSPQVTTVEVEGSTFYLLRFLMNCDGTLIFPKVQPRQTFPQDSSILDAFSSFIVSLNRKNSNDRTSHAKVNSCLVQPVNNSLYDLLVHNLWGIALSFLCAIFPDIQFFFKVTLSLSNISVSPSSEAEDTDIFKMITTGWFIL